MPSDPPSAQTSDIVLVHSSDLHVDDAYTASENDGDGARGLIRVLEVAKAQAADLVIVAGDFFEHNRLPQELLERVGEILAHAGRPVVILPGNHDPAIKQSAWHRGGLGDIEGIHVLGVSNGAAALYPEMDLEVWGLPHFDYYDMAPLKTIRPRTTRWQIATAHGHYEEAPDYGGKPCPSWLISEAQIAATGADYVALGHWNRATRVGNGTVPAYYSGSPDLAETVNLVRLKIDGSVEVKRELIP